MPIILSRIFLWIRGEEIEILFVRELPARVMPDGLVFKTTGDGFSYSKISNGIITANGQSWHSAHAWRCIGKSRKSEHANVDAAIVLVISISSPYRSLGAQAQHSQLHKL